MKQKKWASSFLISARQYILFFGTMAFIITCCMILFLNTMTDVTGFVLERDHIQTAAILTFLNIIFLSLICTVIDIIRRKIMVDRPVKQIIQATNRITHGDFSTNIEFKHFWGANEGFEQIVEHINKMTQELKGIETLRNDFIANVSHELKTPLSVIQNYGTLLQQEDLDPHLQIQYAKIITNTSKKLANLVTNILRLNKLENQQIYPSMTTYDIGEQLRECLLDFEKDWEDKELRLETDIEDGILIQADADLLSLVWNNLISNAIKFNEPRGYLGVTLKSQGHQVIVQIKDSGCGISKDVGQHIFEKFYQGDTSHATKGNGLGLALVKRVIDIVNGSISVQSELHEGSTFTVRIQRYETSN